MTRSPRSLMGERRYSLARDFSAHPGPRYKRQGKHSGEQFRDKLLTWLEEPGTIVLDLDGTSGIGSSFIDEAFGGLVFARGMPASEVRNRIRLKSELDASYILDFEDSLEKAEADRVAGRSKVRVG